MSLLVQVSELIWGLLGPWIYMAKSGSWLPHTIATLVRRRQFGVLFSPHKLRDAWFSNFWGFAGPNVKLNAEQRVLPLLEGRATGGQIVTEP